MLLGSGTVTEDAFLSTRQNNYIASAALSGDDISAAAAIAWMDVSTGSFFTCTSDPETLLSDLARNPPSELLLDARLWKAVTDHSSGLAGILSPLASQIALGLEGCVVTPQDRSSLSSAACLDMLHRVKRENERLSWTRYLSLAVVYHVLSPTMMGCWGSVKWKAWNLRPLALS
jgi:DNA mismatch repair ATPase MutS